MRLLPEPTVLRQTDVYGITVSSIRVHTNHCGGGYHETMLFLNGKNVDGLKDYETYSLFRTWEENHDQLIRKVKSVLAWGPVLRH